jgi:hypothetical protein
VQPPTGDRKFRNEVVRIAELTVNTSQLSHLEFSNCRILGPAVLIPTGGTQILHCNLGGDSPEAIFWEILPGRDYVVGGVGVISCIFSSCQFEGIGWAGSREMYDSMITALSG